MRSQRGVIKKHSLQSGGSCGFTAWSSAHARYGAADADIVSDSFGPINAQIAGGETNRLHLVLLLEDAHQVERLLPANLVDANVHLRGDCKGSTQCLGLEFRRAHTDVSDGLTAR